MKKPLMIVAGIIFGIGVLFAVYHFTTDSSREPIAAKGAVIDESNLRHDIGELSRPDLEMKKLEIVENGFFQGIEVLEADGKTLKKGNIVFVSAQYDHLSEVPDKPVTVQEAMRVWMYLQERSLSLPIVGVYVNVSLSFRFTENGEALVSDDEFRALYQKIESEPLTEEQAIQKLASMWVEQHQYRHW